jgi:hypothetical protein
MGGRSPQADRGRDEVGLRRVKTARRTSRTGGLAPAAAGAWAPLGRAQAPLSRACPSGAT